MRLGARVAAPAVQRVIDRQASLELPIVVGMEARQAERQRNQPGGFGNQVRPAGVGAAHHFGEIGERGQVAQAELLDHHVEGAPLAAMAPEHVAMLEVEWCRIESVGHGHDLRRHDEQEAGAGVDEAADQPWAGDPIDLRPRARHPERPAVRLTRWQAIGADERMPALPPGGVPPVQYLGGDAVASQPGGDTLAERPAILIDDDGRPAGERPPPFGHLCRAAGNRSRNQALVADAGAKVDQRGARRRADEACQLVDGNAVQCRHGERPYESRTR